MSLPDINFAVEAFARELNAEGADFKLERGPTGKWLFWCADTIILDTALRAAIKAADARARHREERRAELDAWRAERNERP